MSLSSLADKVCPPVCRPLLNRVQRSPIGKRIVGGAFWSVVGNGIGKGLTFVAMILVARILGKEIFGEFGLIRSTATTFVAFSSFGMGLTATKYIAELLHTDKERTGRIIGLSYVFTFLSSLVVAIIFYMLAPWLCETQLHKPHLVDVMRLGAILLFLTTFMGTQVSVMTGFQDFRGLAIATFIGGVTMLPIYVIGAYYWGLQGVVIGTILAAGLNLLINSAFIYRNTQKNQIRYAFQQAYKELPVLWSSNIPVVLGGIIFIGTLLVTQLMLVAQPDGASELGFYFGAMNIQMALLFVPTLLQTVFFPIQCESNNQNQNYWRVVKKGFVLTTLISFCAALPMLLFPKFLIELNGSEFSGGETIMFAVGIYGLLNILCASVWYVMLSRNGAWFNVFSALMEAVTVLLLTHFLLAQHWRGVGIVSALICGRIVIFFLYAVFLIFNHIVHNYK